MFNFVITLSVDGRHVLTRQKAQGAGLGQNDSLPTLRKSYVETRETSQCFAITGGIMATSCFLCNSLRPSDAYMRRQSSHHWFR